MPYRWNRARVRATALLLLGLLTTPAALAEKTRNMIQGELTDWYFANTFGTGVYRIGDRTVTILTLPLSYTLREPDDDRWGIRLKLPLSLGLYSLDNAVDDVLNRNFATFAAMPGVEFEKEIGRNWVVKPTFSGGYAQDVSKGNRSTLYELGLRSSWGRSFERVDFVLGNALLYAGNAAQDGITQHLGLLSTGLNFIMPTGGALAGRASNFGVHVVHYLFFNDIDFFLTSESRRSVNQQYEVAFTFGTYRPLEIFGATFDRIGVGFRAGENFFAVRLVTGFVY